MTSPQVRTAKFPVDEEPFVIGARLLALVAYPAQSEMDTYERTERGLCAGVIAVTKADNSELAEALERQYPKYADLQPAAVRKARLGVRRRWDNRMLAARMSLGFFEEGMSGRPARLAPGMARLSLNELSKLVRAQRNLANEHNLEQRVWRGSLPVIHMAAAMQVVLRTLDPGPQSYGYDVNRGDLHDAVLDLASTFQGIVLADTRFGHDRESRLIRLDRSPLSGTGSVF